MPTRIDQTIRLCDQYDNRSAAQAGGTSTVSVVVCLKQGTEETLDEDDKEEAPEESGSVGVALAQRGKENKAVGTNTAAGAAKQKGLRNNRRGEPTVCFNCGKNHPVLECSDIPLEKRKKIMAYKNNEWLKTRAAQQAKQTSKKTGEQVDGQAHLQVTVDDINGRAHHQDDKEDAFVFLQTEGNNKLVTEHQK